MAKKFSPLQMSERFKKTMLVGLGVFLMIIFAVPFGGSRCDRGQTRYGEHDRGQVVATIEGRTIDYGMVDDNRAFNSKLFGVPLAERDALFNLVRLRDAERAGVRVSDKEVANFMHTETFARRARIELAIAEVRWFEKQVKVEPKEVDAYYRHHRARYRLPDGSDRPIAEVREEIIRDVTVQKAKEIGRAKLAEFADRLDTVVGPAIGDIFGKVARSENLAHGQPDFFTARTAVGKLGEVRDAPGLVDLVFTIPIGKLSPPIEYPDGVCVFRVVQRTKGFDTDGKYHPEDEGWMGEGYGVTGRKSFPEFIREFGLSSYQLEKTIREHIASLVVPGLIDSGVLALPDATIEDRYERDNSRAMAAYFALWTSDFADSVAYAEADLQAFYDQRKNVERAPGRVGYLRPPRVSIEYVLGRVDKMEEALDPRKVAQELERYKQGAKNVPEELLNRVRRGMASEELRTLMGKVEGYALNEVGKGRKADLAAAVKAQGVIPPGIITVQRTELFSAQEAEQAVPDLQGGKVAEILFGEKADQYAAEGATTTKPETGTKGEQARQHAISEDFPCPAGRFVFRVLKRESSTEVDYKAIPPAVRQQLVRDVIRNKALGQAKDQAREYRKSLCQAAFSRFADLVGAKPAQVDLADTKAPIPAVGAAVPGLNDQMAVAEPGELSDVFGVGGQFVLARLISREPGKPVRLEVVTCGTADLQKPYEPAVYELEARYVADPYTYLEPPEPIPFKKVEADIGKLLAHRQALAAATQRIGTAAAELVGTRKADIDPLGTRLKLAVQLGVKVDREKTEDTPAIGKALGFHEAVNSLKVGVASGVLASADGRFVFVLKARDAKSATIDFLAASYAALAAEAKPAPKEAQAYYDRCRDSAFMTNDEIKPAPSWRDLAKEAVARVRKVVTEDWGKKPPLARVAQLRDSLVEEAFRTVPEAAVLKSLRKLGLAIFNKGPVVLSSPPELLDREPALLKAILALKPGEVSAPVAVRDGAALAYLDSQPAKDVLNVDLVVLRDKDVAASAGIPAEDDLRRYYDSHKEAFREPEELKARLLLVAYTDLLKGLTATDDELQKEYERSVKADEAAYRDLKQPGAPVLPFGQAKELVRRQVLLGKARAEAEKLLATIKPAAEAPDSDFRTLGEKNAPAYARVSPYFGREEMDFGPLGRVPGLAAAAFAAKESGVVGPVLGSEGACLLKRIELRPSSIPPFEEIQPRVVTALKVDGAAPRVLEALAKLRERALAALAKADDKRAAFRKAVEGEPLPIEVPTRVRVVLAAPFFPTDAGQMRPSVITGVGNKPELTRAAFRLRPGHVSDVVEDADGSACYVANLVSLLAPPKATAQQLLETRLRLIDPTHQLMQLSWDSYYKQQIHFQESR